MFPFQATNLDNKLMTKLSLKTLLVSLAVSMVPNASFAVSLEQVTKDINTLASDEMQGRKSASPGIKKAASYIASRFKNAGLKPLNNESDYLQKFDLFLVKPEQMSVTLNREDIATENALLLTSRKHLSWTEKDKIKTVKIGKDTDFREAMSEINQLKENVIVLVNPSHQKMFNRYRNYFNKGTNKFEVDNGPSALILVTQELDINQLKLSATTKIEKQNLANVVGVLPGKSKPQEFVLFSAHYDHLGMKFNATGSKQDYIYNGADDNASGTSAVINIAEHYAKQKSNERTLIFVAFTAEEIGGYGSKYFSQQLDPNKVISMINIEMIGKTSKFGKGQLWMTGYDRSNLAELLNRNLQGTEFKVHADPYPAQNLFYRSDNATLARLGVPAHSFSSSQIDVDKHYHQASDEVESLDLESMHQAIEILASATKGLAAGKDTPTRVDISQVKPAGTFF